MIIQKESSVLISIVVDQNIITSIISIVCFAFKLFMAEGYVSSFSPKDVQSSAGHGKDTKDGSKNREEDKDVTDSEIKRLTQGRSTFRRFSRRSSKKGSGRRRR